MSYTVNVRTLAEFTAKRGDLDLRFTPSPTSLEGIAGHGIVTSRRGSDYQAEVTLAGTHGAMTVKGRADGYDAAANRLEEIKTHRGRLDRQPDNHRHLHWAQLRLYGWLVCASRELAEIELALVYFDIGTQQETVFRERATADELRRHFEEHCERFIAWAEQEAAHRDARDAALTTLAFPHAEFRRGQRPLAEAVYKAATQGRCLAAQAPTGIGKTVATLFPMLKAAPSRGLDKIFFLTAKTSGRQLALDAMAQITRQGRHAAVRVMELVARDKACEHPDKACHGESCPLAKGFYDRLPAARQAALARSIAVSTLDRAAVREIALANQVCPYYLGQELARWCDVVVGDYNHFFDMSAMLHSLALANEWKVGVLVDEAHNLVDRARKMYSAELSQEQLQAARTGVPAELRRPLDSALRAWGAFNREQETDYAVHEALPERLVMALMKLQAAIGDHLAEHPEGADSTWQQLMFDTLHFTRLAESFAAHSLFDVTLRREGRGTTSTLCLRNVLPAPFLQPRHAAAHTMTLFSATLSPHDYHADTLGLPENAVRLEVDSPFEAAQLEVRVARHISTRYAHRAASVDAIVSLMREQFERRRGNYLAFFSSYDYLHEVAQRLAEQAPGILQWRQSRGMSEGEQADFLARFTEDGQGIGFAVLGGSFAEGVDLPGGRLIGAFIATLGLPQVNPVNEQMKQRLEKAFGAGYDYTYLYPGLQKVVQAAGRVIRTPDDVGVLHLMDDRFARAEVRGLLPAWWAVRS